jgi:hypothetical protein
VRDDSGAILMLIYYIEVYVAKVSIGFLSYLIEPGLLVVANNISKYEQQTIKL